MLARTPILFLANLPGMLRRAFAQEVLFLGYPREAKVGTLKSGFGRHLFRGGLPCRRRPEQRDTYALKVDDSALQAYGDGVCPIVGAEFRKDILDVTFYCFFRDRELGGDLFIGISA